MYAFLFPGQGSQQPGMGKVVHDEFKKAAQVFEEASDTLHFDLKKLCFEGSESDLALTQNTQPCLLTVSIATLRVLQEEFGVQGKVAAGHSVGEYGALVAAGVLSFRDAVRAVRERGLAMQSAVPVGEGGMLAVMGLDEAKIIELCAFAEKSTGKGPLSPANYNSPGQIVISGAHKAIEWLRQDFKPELLWADPPRMKLTALKVSAPFHCSMMKPAEDHMRHILEGIEFSNAQIPVIQNLTASAHQEGSEIRRNLIAQISQPVRWLQSMETLKQMGINRCIEMGTGKVLQGLLKKIDSEFFTVFNTTLIHDIRALEAKT